MSSFTLQGNKSARIDYNNKNTNYSTETESDLSTINRLFIGFAQPTGSNLYKNITGIDVYVNVRNKYSSDTYFSATCRVLKSEFTENTLTYNNRPDETLICGNGSATLSGSGTGWVPISIEESTLTSEPDYLINTILYGISIGTNSSAYVQTTRASNKPYLIVYTDGTSSKLTIDSASPSSGYVAKASANTFRWATAKDGNCIGTLTVASSKLRWKTSASGTATEIDCGTALSYTFPANTFSTDTVLWQAEVTDSQGNTSTTDWMTLTTVEATSTAECVYPKSTMIDGSVENVFQWNHIISTGTAQTAAQLQYSTDGGTTWTSLATVSGSTTSETIAAGTFSSGNAMWRVRTANTDGTYGSWSDAVAFIVVSKPNTPSVSATQNPHPVVSWQASDQQGYRVKVSDIYDSGVLYGADTSLQIPKYLDDGTYVAKVSVVNQYGIWSDEGSSPVVVTHTEGLSISLSATDGYHAIHLSWTTAGSYAEYIVYRDNVAICRTTSKQYTDNLCIGEHKYKVRGVYSSSTNYGISTVVTVSESTEGTAILQINNGQWIDISYQTSSSGTQNENNSIQYSSKYVYGKSYPVYDVSTYKKKTLSLQVGFKESDIADLIQSMVGKEVCVKGRDGAMVIGVLTSTARVNYPLYIEMSLSVEQIEYDEEIAE